MPRLSMLHRGSPRAVRALYDGVPGALPADGRSRVSLFGRGSAFELRSSEQYCQELTRREARNFYWGFVALPKAKRVAIYALYSFARQVDDDVDLDPPPDSSNGGSMVTAASLSNDRFDRHRERLGRCLTGEADDPVMRVLAQVIPRYQIPGEELEALIRGVEMDLKVTRYQSWPELQSYCLLVASAVGRMCVRIFGFCDPSALNFADDLGVAMQLANVLRDVREDLELGRVYLPQDELQRFGVSEQGLLTGDPGPGWEPLVRYQVDRAQCFFQSGLQVTELIPRRAAACVLTMAGIYRSIVEEIAQDPYLPLTRRVSLDGRAKLQVMLRSWLQAM